MKNLNQDRIWEYFQNEGVQSFAANQYRLRFLVSKLLKYQKVLNIGIGNGNFETFASEQGLTVFSLDPDKSAVEKIRQKLSLNDNARVGYSENIPFEDAKFDAVVVSEVLEHLETSNLEKSLLEINRVLRPGGVICGTVPAKEPLEAGVVVCPSCNVKFHRWGHHQSFNVGRMKELLQASNFSILELYERCFWDKSTMSKKVRIEYWIKERLWNFGLHRIGDSLFFLGAKPLHR